MKKSTRIFVLTVKKPKNSSSFHVLLKLYIFSLANCLTLGTFPLTKRKNQKNNKETRLRNDLLRDNDRGHGYPKWTGSHVWHVRTGSFPTHGDRPKHW